MKLSKAFLAIIEAEDNEQGDILLAMMDHPDITLEEIIPEATDFLTQRADYDGNVLVLNRFIALNILEDDEEDEGDEPDDGEISTLDVLSSEIDPEDSDFNDYDDDEEDEDE